MIPRFPTVLFRLSLLIAGVILVVACMLPTPAAAASDYGPWFARPGTAPTKDTPAVYQADMSRPFNSKDVSESTQFQCVLSDGTFLTDDMKSILGSVFSAAAEVYAGDFELKQESGQIGTKKQDSGALYKGSTAMKGFLANERALLAKGQWAPPEDRKIEGGALFGTGDRIDSTIQIGPKRIDVYYEDKYGVDPQVARKVAALIPADAEHPFELSKSLPEACSLNVLEPPDVSFPGLLSDPGQFLLGVVFYLPTKIASIGYETVHAYAFQWTFWTPHTERGDEMWNVAGVCTPSGTVSRKDVMYQCENNKPLGFDTRTTDIQSAKAWYITLAHFLQWMISGTYFLLIGVATILFMLRDNRRSALHVMKVIPRIFLSVLLTIFSTYLIGALITTSNLLVRSLFGFADSWTVGAVNAAMLHAKELAVGGEAVGLLIQVVTGAPTVFFMAMLVVMSALRQVALILLVVIAPAAAFCIVVDSWRPLFQKYLRALLVIIFLPVADALTFKVAMLINPLVTMPDKVFGSLMGVLGLFMVATTMWLLSRMTKAGLGAAMNSQAIAGGAGAAAALGAMSAGMDPGAEATGKMAWLRRQGAGALGASAGLAAAGGAMSAKMFPADKVVGAVHGPSAKPGMLDRAVGKTATAKDSTQSAISKWVDERRRQRQLGQVGVSELGADEMQRWDRLAFDAAAAHGVSARDWAKMSLSQKQPFFDNVTGPEASIRHSGGRFYMERSGEMLSQTAAQAASTGAQMARDSGYGKAAAYGTAGGAGAALAGAAVRSATSGRGAGGGAGSPSRPQDEQLFDPGTGAIVHDPGVYEGNAFHPGHGEMPGAPGVHPDGEQAYAQSQHNERMEQLAEEQLEVQKKELEQAEQTGRGINQVQENISPEKRRRRNRLIDE